MLSFLSNLMASNDDLDDYITVFKAINTGHDGLISYEELKKALMQNTEEFANTSEDDWEEILVTMDANGDGKIDFPEFVAAAYDRQKLLNKKNIKIAFAMFDIDGDGFISKEEFQQVLGTVNPNSDALKEMLEQWTQVLKDVDTDGDGQLSIDEFEKAMN